MYVSYAFEVEPSQAENNHTPDFLPRTPSRISWRSRRTPSTTISLLSGMLLTLWRSRQIPTWMLWSDVQAWMGGSHHRSRWPNRGSAVTSNGLAGRLGRTYMKFRCWQCWPLTNLFARCSQATSFWPT